MKRPPFLPMQISTRYLQFRQSAGIGKLYVTNSDFSNGIGRLCVIILHPFLLPMSLTRHGIFLWASFRNRGEGAGIPQSYKSKSLDEGTV